MEQDDGDGAEEAVTASTVDKECEAGACELGIRYPTLQSIYAGKLNKQSMQVNIIHDIIVIFMISLMISHMICRCRAEKPMLEQLIAILTIISQARSAWTCIFSSLPVWMSFKDNLMLCAQMISSLGQDGSSISIANPTRFSAGCLQNWQRG